MKVLFIGGTGFISTAVSRLALARGIELFHLNRGKRESDIPGVQSLVADVHQPAPPPPAAGPPPPTSPSPARPARPWATRPGTWWWTGSPTPPPTSSATWRSFAA